jgi:hypothetical protein
VETQFLEHRLMQHFNLHADLINLYHSQQHEASDVAAAEEMTVLRAADGCIIVLWSAAPYSLKTTA